MFRYFKRVKKRKDKSSSEAVSALSLKITPYHNEIQPLRQNYNWDCGITCIKMILPPDKRSYLEENFEGICQEEGFGQSTWTIDLCFLLKRLNIDHVMYTTNMGVNQSHRKHKYYKDIIDKDSERVRARFSSNVIRCEEREVDVHEVCDHVVKSGPAILLTDVSLLHCLHCGHNRLTSALRSMFGGAYKGHYVLVTGVRGGKVEFVDPARGTVCVASRRGLTAAMTATGTDNDAILITL